MVDPVMIKMFFPLENTDSIHNGKDFGTGQGSKILLRMEIHCTWVLRY
jgi:hypothetical protein